MSVMSDRWPFHGDDKETEMRGSPATSGWNTSASRESAPSFASASGYSGYSSATTGAHSARSPQSSSKAAKTAAIRSDTRGSQDDAQEDQRLLVTHAPQPVAESQIIGKLLYAELFDDDGSMPNVLAITLRNGRYMLTLPIRYERRVGEAHLNEIEERMKSDRFRAAADAIVEAAKPLYRIDDSTAFVVTREGWVFVQRQPQGVIAAQLGWMPNAPHAPVWGLSDTLWRVWYAAALFAKTRHPLTVPIGVVTAVIGMFIIVWGVFAWVEFLPQFAEALGGIWILSKMPWEFRWAIAFAVNIMEAWGLFLVRGRVPRFVGIAASASAMAAYTAYAVQNAPGSLESQIASGIVAFFLSVGLEAVILHAIAVVVPLLTLVPSAYFSLMDIASDSMRRWAEERDSRRQGRIL